MGEGDYCPDCGVSDPEDGCPECGRPCENKFHGEHADGAEVERLKRLIGNHTAWTIGAEGIEQNDEWHNDQELRRALYPDEKEGRVADA